MVSTLLFLSSRLSHQESLFINRAIHCLFSLSLYHFIEFAFDIEILNACNTLELTEVTLVYAPDSKQFACTRHNIVGEFAKLYLP